MRQAIAKSSILDEGRFSKISFSEVKIINFVVATICEPELF